MADIPVIAVTVDALAAEGAGNRSIRLVAADGGWLPAFEAGAHVDLHLPGGLSRPYSIASAPHQRDHYLLCVRREAASRGGSAHVHDRLAVGDKLSISAPRNLFALQPAGRYLLMAGGIGLTPLMSMAEALEADSAAFALHVFVRSRNELAFADRLAAGFRHGRAEVHADDEGGDPRDALPAALHAPAADHRIYLCGPNGFMRHVTQAAATRGWSPENIHREAFGPDDPRPAAADHPFEVELQSTGRRFTIPIGRSIAAVLGEAGIAVPLSCEMGLCGACLTRVTAGTPDHRDSVQSDAEKAAKVQQIALCCSRSRTVRLTLAL